LHHLTGWKLLQRDQARRLRYQESQRLQGSTVKTPNGWLPEQSKGQIKRYLSKLVK